MISYRKMIVNDMPSALQLCRYAGWNQLERDWQIFLNESADGCFVAVHDQHKVVGTVSTINFEQRFGWIGMVIVDPNYKRQGIGTELLKCALNFLKDLPCMKLDATPAGKEVYVKLDFKDEYALSRMVGMSVNLGEKPEKIEAKKMTSDDLADVFEKDRLIFGARRDSLLSQVYFNAPDLSYVVREKGQLTGYCFGREGFNFRHIGPIVADNADVARMLLAAAVMLPSSQPIVLDTMHFDKQWMRWLNSIGFAEQRPFIRMFKGNNQYPGVPEKQFAILGPEFG